MMKYKVGNREEVPVGPIVPMMCPRMIRVIVRHWFAR